MKKQTAVEWLQLQIDNKDMGEIPMWVYEFINQAIAMEKEQIMEAARKCHFEGVRQSAKTSESYISYSENYYFCTYGK